MGFLAAVELAPSLFFAVHLGAWTDRRRSRRSILIGADLGRVALLLGAVGSILGSACAKSVSARIGLGNALILSFVIAPLPRVLVPPASGPPVVSMALLTIAELVSGVGVMIFDVGLGSV